MSYFLTLNLLLIIALAMLAIVLAMLEMAVLSAIGLATMIVALDLALVFGAQVEAILVHMVVAMVLIDHHLVEEVEEFHLSLLIGHPPVVPLQTIILACMALAP